MTLNVTHPIANQQFTSPLTVDGIATGTAGAEPRIIEQVTVQVDDQAPVDAPLVRLPKLRASDPQQVLFSVTVPVIGAGQHQATVTAIDTDGDSTVQTVPFTIAALAVPAAPTGITATPISYYQIAIQWNQSFAIPSINQSYTIYRSTSQSGPFTPVAQINALCRDASTVDIVRM
jgi:hypothetical protein